MSQNYYQVLEVSASAPAADIKRAYRRLATQYHPDKHGGDPRYEEQFKAVAVAYQVLSDPDRRAQYDYQLQIAARQTEERRRAASPAARPQGYAPAAPAQSNPPLRTRRPAGSRERHYQRIPRQRVRFTRQDYILSGVLLGLLLLFGLSVKVVMDRMAATEHYEEAQRELASGHWFSAIGSLNLMLDIRPDFAPALDLLGRINQDSARNFVGAAATYRAALTATDAPLAPTEAARVLWRLGQCQVALNQPYLADSSYCRALALDTTLADAYLARGENRLLDLNQPAKALADLRRGHHQYQHQGRATPLAYLQAEGAALTRLARYSEARTVYQEALLTRPQDGRTLFLLGRLAQQVGDSARGCEFFRRGAAVGYSYAAAAVEKCR